ncbi:hypothetical protein BC831DRAFT_461303 [Entophlyctis helioformis]|nr:hypothetical protein BC831DRAFT_461303 [Entophlyctis helioformis]
MQRVMDTAGRPCRSVASPPASVRVPVVVLGVLVLRQRRLLKRSFPALLARQHASCTYHHVVANNRIRVPVLVVVGWALLSGRQRKGLPCLVDRRTPALGKHIPAVVHAHEVVVHPPPGRTQTRTQRHRSLQRVLVPHAEQRRRRRRRMQSNVRHLQRVRCRVLLPHKERERRRRVARRASQQRVPVLDIDGRDGGERLPRLVLHEREGDRGEPHRICKCAGRRRLHLWSKSSLCDCQGEGGNGRRLSAFRAVA